MREFESPSQIEESGWPQCALCGRHVPPEMITLHHLKPRERGGKAEDRRPLCRPCHKQLHAMFSNRELEKLYGSLELLKNSEKLQPFLTWIRKQKPGRNFRTVASWSNSKARNRRRRGR